MSERSDRVQRKTLAKASPAGFAWYASGGKEGESRWYPADHLILLSQKLVDVAMGRTKRLMVFMPPRHGKSELISRYFPAWYLGNFPDRKVMLCSYADTFAASWGRRARDEMKEWGPELFGVTVNPETAGGQQWEVLGRDGIMVTAGVGGGITGKGAHLLVIDDPVKNAEDAASTIIQEKQIDWWKSTARTRLQPGGSAVLVMTRWHEGDLAGQLIRNWLDEDGDEWEVLTLPALAEDRCTVSYPPAKTLDVGEDALGRKPGQALWPVDGDGKIWFDEAELERTRKAQGAYWFNAMYQQRPSAAEGNLFKRSNFRYFSRHESGFLTIHRDSGDYVFDPAYARAKFCTVDTAATEDKKADYTVVATWLVTVDNELLLIDRQREQYEVGDVKRLIRRVHYAHRPGIVYIEKATVALGIIQELVREGLPIVPVVPDKDKVARALPMVARYEAHAVFHPRGPLWVEDEWEPELLNFPNAVNDDQVDVAAYAGLKLPFLAQQNDGGAGGKPRGGKTTIAGDMRSRAL